LDFHKKQKKNKKKNNNNRQMCLLSTPFFFFLFFLIDWGNSYKGGSFPFMIPNQTKTELKYIQKLKNLANKWPGPFKWLYNAVLKVKGKHINTSPTASPLEICNNHQKMAGTVKPLLESEKMIAGKRDANTISKYSSFPKRKTITQVT